MGRRVDAPGRDAVAHEIQDRCQGHPQITGVYHYHSVTSCLDNKRIPNGRSELVGYALDGFAIYGPHDVGGKLLSSDDLDPETLEALTAANARREIERRKLLPGYQDL